MAAKEREGGGFDGEEAALEGEAAGEAAEAAAGGYYAVAGDGYEYGVGGAGCGYGPRGGGMSAHPRQLAVGYALATGNAHKAAPYRLLEFGARKP